MAIRGQNVPLKKILLDSFKGRLGVIFKTPPKMSPPLKKKKKKASIEVNLSAKSREILV